MKKQRLASNYVIPINPSNKRIMPWKEGEEDATARGISARKHRETAERMWQVKRKQIVSDELANLIYASPSNNPIYKRTMDAIKSHQGRAMQVVLVSTNQASLDLFAEQSPGDAYTIEFIREELIEKGWLHTQVRFQPIGLTGGHILLVSDFTV